MAWNFKSPKMEQVVVKIGTIREKPLPRWLVSQSIYQIGSHLKTPFAKKIGARSYYKPSSSGVIRIDSNNPVYKKRIQQFQDNCKLNAEITPKIYDHYSDGKQFQTTYKWLEEDVTRVPIDFYPKITWDHIKFIDSSFDDSGKKLRIWLARQAQQLIMRDMRKPLKAGSISSVPVLAFLLMVARMYGEDISVKNDVDLNENLYNIRSSQQGEYEKKFKEYAGDKWWKDHKDKMIELTPWWKRVKEIKIDQFKEMADFAKYCKFVLKDNEKEKIKKVVLKVNSFIEFIKITGRDKTESDKVEYDMNDVYALKTKIITTGNSEKNFTDITSTTFDKYVTISEKRFFDINKSPLKSLGDDSKAKGVSRNLDLVYSQIGSLKVVERALASIFNNDGTIVKDNDVKNNLIKVLTENVNVLSHLKVIEKSLLPTYEAHQSGIMYKLLFEGEYLPEKSTEVKSITRDVLINKKVLDDKEIEKMIADKNTLVFLKEKSSMIKISLQKKDADVAELVKVVFAYYLPWLIVNKIDYLEKFKNISNERVNKVYKTNPALIETLNREGFKERAANATCKYFITNTSDTLD